MPQEKVITVYSFSELSDKAKDKVLSDLYYCNTDNDWWSFIYDDAKNVNIKITGFDLDRRSSCDIELLSSAYEVATKIIQEHGETCETYKTAAGFIAEYDKLVAKYSDGVDLTRVAEDNEYEFDQEADEIEADFKRSIAEDYRMILQREYEYLTSKEAIIETIEANNWTFTESGKMENL